MSDTPCDSQWSNISAGDCGGWSNSEPPTNCDQWPTNEDWILADAIWRDVLHYWRDLAAWRDSATTNWVTT